jgi:hypothetical protein
MGGMDRTLGLALGVVSLAALWGCSITVKSQTKYTNGTVTAQSMGAFKGEQIHVVNQNGNVIVKGDPNATSVSVSATPFAFADNSTDGSAALADVKTSIKIDQSQSGVIDVRCSEASQGHGSAANGTTGCDNFTVTVPAGTAQAPLTLVANASNGSLDVTGVAGSVQADASNGTVQASITPEKGSTVEVSSGNGDVTVALPAAFSCDSLSIQASGPGSAVTIGSGFTSKVTATSTSVGTAGMGAASITVSTQNGSISLQPQ